MKKIKLSVLALMPMLAFSQHSINHNWNMDAGSTGNDKHYAIAYSGATDDVISAGYFINNTMDVNTGGTPFTLTNPSGAASEREAFLISRDATTGNLNWAINFGGNSGASHCECTDVKTDGSGNIYVAGYYKRGLTINLTYSTSPMVIPNTVFHGKEGFIAKFDSNGSLLWFTRVGGVSNSSEPEDHVAKIDLNSTAIYATGFYRSAFGTAKVTGTGSSLSIPTSNGSSDVFITRLNLATGNPDWVFNIGSPRSTSSNQETIKDIAVDGSGNIAVTGRYEQILGEQFIVAPDGSSTSALTYGSNTTRSYLAVYQETGTPVLKWVVAVNGTLTTLTECEGKAIAFDGSQNVFWSGYYENNIDLDPSTSSGHTAFHTNNGGRDIFLSKFTASGDFMWSKNYGGTSNDYCEDMAFDIANNRLYMTGSFLNTINFGGSGTSLTSFGLEDYFVAVLNINGYHERSIRNGSTSKESGNAISIDGSGAIYIAADHGNAFDVNHDSGISNCISYGGTDALTVKFDYSDYNTEARISPNGTGNLLTEQNVNTFQKGVKDFENKNMSVFPNPTNGDLTIVLPDEKLNNEIRLEIVDINGKMLSINKTYYKGKFNINLNSFESGTYTVFIYGLDFTYQERIVKQ